MRLDISIEGFFDFFLGTWFKGPIQFLLLIAIIIYIYYRVTGKFKLPWDKSNNENRNNNTGANYVINGSQSAYKVPLKEKIESFIRKILGR